MKVIAIVLMCLTMGGCKWFTKPVPETIYTDVPVPVLSVPMPPHIVWPETLSVTDAPDVTTIEDPEERLRVAMELVAEESRIARINQANYRSTISQCMIMHEEYTELSKMGQDKIEEIIRRNYSNNIIDFINTFYRSNRNP